MLTPVFAPDPLELIFTNSIEGVPDALLQILVSRLRW